MYSKKHSINSVIIHLSMVSGIPWGPWNISPLDKGEVLYHQK